MRLFINSILDVAKSVLPIVFLVLFVHFFLSPLNPNLLLAFLIGAFSIILGLGIFFVGIDLSVTEIGKHMGDLAARNNTAIGILLTGLFFGFLVTVAEPDVMILAKEISQVSGGAISSILIVVAVALGVGLLIGMGFVRMVKDWKPHLFFGVFYGTYIFLLIFVPETFQAIAFDASGASTGALTTPFFLALGLGLAKLKGSFKGESESFGMVGTASMGPILALLCLSFIKKLDPVSEAASRVLNENILQAFQMNLVKVISESFFGLLPLILIFYILNFIFFKLKTKDLKKINFGLLVTFVGLALFLLGVYSGFMDLGYDIGYKLAGNQSKFLLPIFGLFLGMVVVLAEPSVKVLSSQVEDVTAGSIRNVYIIIALCIGVGIAVAISCLRAMYPNFKFWMIASPVFILTILLSFKVRPIFVGIAYDSGGVASGPMTATFIVSVLQGAADLIPTADPLIDGFGVLATVAMMPILTVMFMGHLFEVKSKRGEKLYD